MIMQNRTAQKHMDHGVDVDWAPVRSWLERVLPKERLAELGLVAATLATLGWVTFALLQALGSYQFVGAGPF
jgi:hypothetical protein